MVSAGRPVLEKLFLFRPGPRVPLLVNLDVNDMGAAADRAILNVFLDRSRREVDGDDDLLAARVTDVGYLVLHLNRATGPATGPAVAAGSAVVPENVSRRKASGHETFPRILLISAAVNDRIVCVVTLSAELRDSIAVVAASSSGASKMMTPS
jgi:hypothetical protein